MCIRDRFGEDRDTNLPKKYVPKGLSKEDKKKQVKSIKEGTDRPKVDYKTKRSSHIIKFENKYNKKINDFSWISKNLLKREGINQIIKKGEGAYYSAGSRPNTSARQWALARLASALTGGAAAKVDRNILDEYKVK